MITEVKVSGITFVLENIKDTPKGKFLELYAPGGAYEKAGIAQSKPTIDLTNFNYDRVWDTLMLEVEQVMTPTEIKAKMEAATTKKEKTRLQKKYESMTKK